MPAYDDSRFDPPAPVALVSICHPDREVAVADVPMLMDSGADATLILISAVASLASSIRASGISSWGSMGQPASRKAFVPFSSSWGGNFTGVTSWSTLRLELSVAMC